MRLRCIFFMFLKNNSSHVIELQDINSILIKIIIVVCKGWAYQPVPSSNMKQLWGLWVTFLLFKQVTLILEDQVFYAGFLSWRLHKAGSPLHVVGLSVTRIPTCYLDLIRMQPIAFIWNLLYVWRFSLYYQNAKKAISLCYTRLS